MAVKILIVLCLVLTGVGFGVWDALRTPPQIYKSAPEDEAGLLQTVPNPSFSSIDGKRYALHDFKGKIVVLNFWATWCAPCAVEFPALLDLAAHETDHLVLIALSVDEEPERIAEFVEKFASHILQEPAPQNVIIAHDPGKAISQDLFQTVLYPETFIIGPDMKIKTKIAGLTDWAGDDILSLIEELSGE